VGLKLLCVLEKERREGGYNSEGGLRGPKEGRRKKEKKGPGNCYRRYHTVHNSGGVLCLPNYWNFRNVIGF